MKTLCLSCFVGFCRSMLYTFEIPFHRYSFFFICLMCPHLLSFSSTQKYLISCFHYLKNPCTHASLFSHEKNWLAVYLQVVQKSASFAEFCWMLPWHIYTVNTEITWTFWRRIRFLYSTQRSCYPQVCVSLSKSAVWCRVAPWFLFLFFFLGFLSDFLAWSTWGDPLLEQLVLFIL